LSGFYSGNNVKSIECELLGVGIYTILRVWSFEDERLWALVGATL